jgi:alpha-glucosidase
LPIDSIGCLTVVSGVACVANLSAGPVELPGGEVLLASGPLAGGLLPPDTSAWLRVVSR